MKKKCGLFLSSHHLVVDEHGKPVPLAAAKALWESGAVVDFNLAFQRLATRANWDFEELARQYAEMDRARGLAP